MNNIITNSKYLLLKTLSLAMMVQIQACYCMENRIGEDFSDDYIHDQDNLDGSLTEIESGDEESKYIIDEGKSNNIISKYFQKIINSSKYDININQYVDEFINLISKTENKQIKFYKKEQYDFYKKETISTLKIIYNDEFFEDLIKNYDNDSIEMLCNILKSKRVQYYLKENTKTPIFDHNESFN